MKYVPFYIPNRDKKILFLHMKRQGAHLFMGPVPPCFAETLTMNSFMTTCKLRLDLESKEMSAS